MFFFLHTIVKQQTLNMIQFAFPLSCNIMKSILVYHIHIFLKAYPRSVLTYPELVCIYRFQKLATKEINNLVPCWWLKHVWDYCRLASVVP
jgi:hypothetical protein